MDPRGGAAAPPEAGSGEPSADVSTDPGSVEQAPPWGLDRIDQLKMPLNGKYRYTTSGKGVTAYILDTGLYTRHSDFGNRAVKGFTAVEDGNGANDCNGHGTHVAGIIGGARHGVAKDVRLIAVRVLNCLGEGTFAGVIAGVDWVTYHHAGPSVANMSLNGTFHQPLNDAVANSIAQGVTYALAAGNHYGNACGESPAATPTALTVAATDQNDERPAWSNSGACVDLFAPGVDIPSAWIGGKNATNVLSGTSMSAPHVAGLAAAYLQSNPYGTPETVRAALTTAAADVVGNPGDATPNLLARKWNGTLKQVSTSSYQPDGTHWRQRAGHIQVWLTGTPGTDPDLYLQWWNGDAWQNVAKSAGDTANERIFHWGSGGSYRIMIYAYSGTGTYDVWTVRQA
jgi:subtilisin family serine protease